MLLHSAVVDVKRFGVRVYLVLLVACLAAITYMACSLVYQALNNIDHG